MSAAAVQPERPHRIYSDREVWDSVEFEKRTNGDRGKFGRAAARYRKPDGTAYTDEWARLKWTKHEKKLREERGKSLVLVIPTPEPEPADELAYTPPPGYDDLLRGIEAARLEARRTLAYQQADEVEALCNRIGDGLTELLNLHSQIQRQRAMTDEERWLLQLNISARKLAKSTNEQALCQVFERERTRPVAFAKPDLAIVPTLLLAVGLVLMASVPVVIPQRHGWVLAVVCFVGALVACWFAGRFRQVLRDDPFRLIE